MLPTSPYKDCSTVNNYSIQLFKHHFNTPINMLWFCRFSYIIMKVFVTVYEETFIFEMLENVLTSNLTMFCRIVTMKAKDILYSIEAATT